MIQPTEHRPRAAHGQERLAGWQRTVVSQERLAERLRMSSAANVSQQLRRFDKKAALGKLPDKMKQFLEQAHPTEP
jgi:hypothetical protein